MRKCSQLVVLLALILTAGISTSNAKNIVVAGGEEYLAFAEEMPSIVGGLEAIYKNIKYPEMAQKAGVSGNVYVLAFINESGNVDDVKVVKGIGAGCDEEVVKAVKQAKFTPGKNAGQNVKVKLTLSISFKLK